MAIPDGTTLYGRVIMEIWSFRGYFWNYVAVDTDLPSGLFINIIY